MIILGGRWMEWHGMVCAMHTLDECMRACVCKYVFEMNVIREQSSSTRARRSPYTEAEMGSIYG